VVDVASANLASVQLRLQMLDRNLRPDSLGPMLGLSDRTIYNALHDRPLSDDTKWRIARWLGEDPSTFWPPMPGKRQPGGSRGRVAA
jgi:hypothetical protein